MRPKAEKVYEQWLVVEGHGMFPVDMLRHDTCFPDSQLDVSDLCRQPGDSDFMEPRRVVLCSRSKGPNGVTPERWLSFGWRVLLATYDRGQALDRKRGG